MHIHDINLTTMNNLHLYNELYKVLRMEDRFCTDAGELIRNNIETAALNLNPELIRLLLGNDLLFRHFFADVDGVKVFDKVKFQRFIMNKQFLPDSYTSFKNKIGLTTDDGRFITDSREVVLSWPFKDCMLEGGQTKEDAKRDEVFWNETLAPDEINRLTEPKVFTAFKRYDKDGEHKVEHLLPTDNLIIKGNNLLALYSLKEKYAGRVKLIYIDPPYNTGSDSFGYNDNFNHSTWLTFMKNRIEVAKDLLTNDGIFCVQCDDHEQAYLKVLMDGIVGLRFLNVIAVKMSEASGVKMNHAKSRFPKLKEYILVYVKPSFKSFVCVDKYRQEEWDKENNILLEGLTQSEREKLIDIECREENTEEDVAQANKILSHITLRSLADVMKENGIKTESEQLEWCLNNAYRIIKTAGASGIAKLMRANESMIPNQDVASFLSKKKQIFFYLCKFNRNVTQPRMQVLFADSNVYKNPCDFWQDIKTTGAIADEGGVQMANGKKPEKILYRLIKTMTVEGDYVMDFHLGSGTTIAVAHKMDRHYIGCEQLDDQMELTKTRLSNVINGESSGADELRNWQGGGSFVYCELSKANQNFVEQIETATTKKALSDIWKQMQQTGFLSYKIKAEDINDNAESFETLSLDDQKRFLIECLDKNLLYVPLSDIDNADYNVGDEDKRLTREFYKKEV